MSSVGSYLRERREVRGVSLKEMARATRVRERYLEALEADEFSELPAGVFTKGFIRACCQVLSEPPDEALRIYAAQLGLPATLGETSRPPGLAEREGRAREPILITLVLLVALGVALFGLTFALQSRQRQPSVSLSRPSEAPPPAASEPVAPPAVPQSAPTPPAPRAAGTPPAPTPAGSSVRVEGPEPMRTPTAGVFVPTPTPPAPPAHRLVARVKEPTWIRVRTDDGHVTEETMSPGDVREWVSSRRFVLTIGNAGGIALELNGRPLPALGPSGSVIPRLVIPSDQQ
jgi:cytoskeleton protein RodZ